MLGVVGLTVPSLSGLPAYRGRKGDNASSASLFDALLLLVRKAIYRYLFRDFEDLKLVRRVDFAVLPCV